MHRQIRTQYERARAQMQAALDKLPLRADDFTPESCDEALTVLAHAHRKMNEAVMDIDEALWEMSLDDRHAD